MRFEQKWVLSVACGKSQEPLLKAAKKQGYSIIGVDQSPSSDLVDFPIRLSTHDTEKVLFELKNGDYPKFDAVLCRSSGPAVRTAQVVADYFHLPSCGSLIAESSVSKFVLHENCMKLGIPTIPCLQASHCKYLPPDWAEVVIKPSQPIYGKKNVYKSKAIEDNNDYINLCCNESLDGKAVIQPYIRGNDIAVSAMCLYGRVLSIFPFLENNHFQGGRIQHQGLSAQAKPLPTPALKDIMSSATQVIAHSNASGFVFFTFRLINNLNCLLYEVNPGLCGDDIVEGYFQKTFPDFDFFDADVSLMTGIEPKNRVFAASPSLDRS